MLIGTGLQQTVMQGKSYFMAQRSREMGTKVHANALDKVMHGSVNKYFDVTPIGRVIQKFNSEIQVFRGGLVANISSSFNMLSMACF